MSITLISVLSYYALVAILSAAFSVKEARNYKETLIGVPISVLWPISAVIALILLLKEK